MSYFYAALIGVIAIFAVVLSAKALHRWDNIGPPEINPPWWRTWKRPALSIFVAFLIGALTKLSSSWDPTWPLALFFNNIAPLVYRRIGVGLWSLQVEILAAYAAWLSATILLGSDLMDYLPNALIMWIGCGIGSAVIMLKVGPHFDQLFRPGGRKARSG